LTEPVVGVNEVVEADTFTVYPNPTSGLATIAFTKPAPFCSLFTLDGRIVRQWPLVGIDGRFSVDLSNLSTGTYVVQIGTESQLISIAR
jgi:hypothetical protein